MVARNVKQLESTCSELNALAKSQQSGAVAKYYNLDITSGFDVVRSFVFLMEFKLPFVKSKGKRVMSLDKGSDRKS